MKALMSTNEAANYIGYKSQTLRMSRVTGTLGGIPSPEYIKVGEKTVRYRVSDLDEWIEKQVSASKGED